MTRPILVHLIAAARPNFMKVAPLWHALKATDDFRPKIVHTGQHYDAAMSDDIFADLGLPAPDHHLGIGSGTHAEQTGRVMIAYEALAMQERPGWLIVVGDVNSTAACSMAAGKLRIPIVHLEAGLRSRDRDMPEELNRLVTDVLADVLWTPSPDADKNLIAEGIPAERITRVGNIMMDSYELVRPAIMAADAPGELGYKPGSYGVVTLHRPSNVDGRQELSAVVAFLLKIGQRLNVAFPVHPRTQKNLDSFGLTARLAESGKIRLLPPQGYLENLSLMLNAAVVITDSGGIQEETSWLGVPCLTVRENTERPVTVSLGTNTLVGRDFEMAGQLVSDILDGTYKTGSQIPGWDGHAAERAAEAIAGFLAKQA